LDSNKATGGNAVATGGTAVAIGQGGAGGAGGSGGNASSDQAQKQAQSQGQNQGQSQSASANNGGQSNSQSTSYSSPRETPSSYAFAMPTAPCRVANSQGGASGFFSFSLSQSREDKGCTLRELARSFASIGDVAAARKILCSTKEAKAAKACEGVMGTLKSEVILDGKR